MTQEDTHLSLFLPGSPGALLQFMTCANNTDFKFFYNVILLHQIITENTFSFQVSDIIKQSDHLLLLVWQVITAGRKIWRLTSKYMFKNASKYINKHITNMNLILDSAK